MGEHPHPAGADGTDHALPARAASTTGGCVRHVDDDDVGLRWRRVEAAAPRRAGGRARGPRPSARGDGRARRDRPRRARRPGACRRPSACAGRAPHDLSAEPTISEPTGAPRPLDRHTAIVSATAPYAVNGVPVATCAFQIRAPSRCSAQPSSSRERPERLQIGQRAARCHRRSCGCSRPRSRSCGRRTAPCRARASSGWRRRSTCPCGRPGATGQAGERTVRPELGAQDVRAAPRRAPPARARPALPAPSTLAIVPVGTNSAAS